MTKSAVIGAGGLTKIAEMICGDSPFDFFPYRSSSYLTRFFIDLDFDYVHDGSTRRHWVNDVLKELNSKQPAAQGLPSREIIKIVESVLHPESFLFNDKVDREKAKDAMKVCLKSYGLTIAELPNGLVKLCPLHGEFVSTDYQEIPAEKLLTFKPSIFQVPSKPQNPRLVSVMMPFSASFNGTYDAIKRVTDYMGLECLRADDIWENSTFIQDIFDLIFCAKVVVVDFTARNPNVMYETGIAHTLGKTVIPITQSIDDIPSDLGHHRALKYLPNEQGYKDLSNELYKRLKSIVEK
ncbi:MAG TPA: hypothetical protein DE312_07120 [Gallionella sp.]|nr:MAG: hypothetical protein A2Z87_13365 [Gallionellales bacterium GWA2_54_124]OGT17274.1 MAG: hypothetical protein A2522_06885 [Gallionellales bacterium RIFOXYD12_FULL_53_10]OGT96091.1 MAG: hypothetical protein A2298_02130 [Gammaproteobacteria bacterium RIFOXYB2_FULL_38_6]HCI53070.1 hypothetical protein [Gallionella sp.]